MYHRRICHTTLLLLFCSLGASSAFAQARQRVAAAYEDTVRIAIIWNDPIGNCSDATAPVGEKTRDFVIAALDTARLTHTKVIGNYRDGRKADWSDIEAMWGPDSLPHVIVHVNAGWSLNWNGPELSAIFENAVNSEIGVVSIGDDAANLAEDVFGFVGVNNAPGPLGDGLDYNLENGPIDSLFITMLRENDERLKQRDPETGALEYPFLNGIISNAVDSLMDGDQLDFHKPGEGRCQADADQYNVQYPNWTTYLGYQQGYWDDGTGYAVRPDIAEEELDVIVAIQDTFQNVFEFTVRRGVALSLQPQFLQNTTAAQQIVYDAIMFASLAHTLQFSIPDSLELRVSNDTIRAGDTALVEAFILDQYDSVQERLSAGVRWRLDPDARREGDALFDTIGQFARVTGTRSWRSISVIASYYDTTLDRTLYNTARVYITPGPAARIVIERAADTPLPWAAMESDIGLNQPAPLDRIIIGAGETKKYAYAIRRDRYGNFVERAETAIWSAFSPQLLTIAASAGKQWEGDMTRRFGARGETAITAGDAGLRPDTVPVFITEAFIERMRLVDAAAPAEALAGIEMNTDQQLTVQVQGIWSDDTSDTWRDVTGIWSLAGVPRAVQSAIPLPAGQAGAWTIDPVNPGEDSIHVASADEGAASVSVPLHVVQAAPRLVRIRILTPARQRIAGSPLHLEVMVENSDGPVPGQWCGAATYEDLLDAPSHSWQPFVYVDGDTAALADTVNECFRQGVDTVEATLFYASEDELHQITVRINDSLSAQTERFRLYPGPLAQLRLETPAGADAPGPTTLRYPDDVLNLVAAGYDAYDNRIGPAPSDWSATESLHAPETDSAVQLYYTTEMVEAGEHGEIVAAAVVNPAARDSIEVTIIGPKASLTAAITRDLNGDGYLDAVELRLNKPVRIDPDSAVGLVSVVHQSATFTPLEIEPANRTEGEDSVFIVSLRQEENGIPQTAWLPRVSLRSFHEIENTDAVRCADGAGPVIWNAAKQVSSAENRTRDRVTVSFSEPIASPQGNPFQQDNAPALTLAAWRATDSEFILETLMLEDIERFAEVDDRELVFYMENGRDLSADHFLNIRVAPPLLADRAGLNEPHEDNRKARVVIQGELGDLVIGPNPMKPVNSHGEKRLSSRDPDQAFRWAKNEGGVILIAHIYLPGATGDQDGNLDGYTIRGKLLIFDAAGNVVYLCENDNDLIPPRWRNDPTYREGGNQRLILYWNGITKANKKAAPGLYRAALLLETPGEQRKLRGNIGIIR